MNDRLRRQLAFIIEADKLKAIVRQNYLADGSRRENDAEHSWHLALMVAVLAEHAATGNLDLLRILKMVLIHDLVEIDAGDAFVYDEAARAAAEAKERAAAERIFGLLPDDQRDEYRALWEEFEAAATPEARFARAVDRLAPLMLNYHSGGIMWRAKGLRAEQVRAVNRRIEAGAPALWAVAETMIDEATRAGALIADAPVTPMD
jgi:putative hydrolase of HD superfamily